MFCCRIRVYMSRGNPEVRNSCPLPPYTATNFTADSPQIFNTLQSYARTSPSYPLPPGSDARQVYMNTQNVSYFNTMNQQVSHVKAQNATTSSQMPYPTFKSHHERLMYIQGLTASAARIAITGQNPSAPAGVPVSTIYQIINGP